MYKFVLFFYALAVATAVPTTTMNGNLVVGGACKDGEWACTPGGTKALQCSFGKWLLNNDCEAQNLKCLPNDYECIPKDDWRFGTPTTTSCPAPSTKTVTNYKTKTVTDHETITKFKTKTVTKSATCPTTTPPLGTPNECVTGSFRCHGQEVHQCNHGSWVTIATCAPDLFCLPNDYECVPRSRAWEFGITL